MKPVFPSDLRSRGALARGFSLLEMLIGIGILSVVVLALYALFDQTQKALRANVNQVDVSEGGRSVLDLLVRDVMRAAASGINTNYVVDRRGDIVRTVPPGTNLVVIRTTGGLTGSPWEEIFGDQNRRKSALHELFYLIEPQPGRWLGAGLFVAGENPMDTVDGLGTLWRYEDTSPVGARGVRGAEEISVLNNRFLNDSAYRTNHVSRLIDGVVFFRVTPFGPQGQPLDDTYLTETNSAVPQGVLIGSTRYTAPLKIDATFFKDRMLPSAIEIELGILPTQLVDQYRSMDVPNVRNRFLTNNAANVLVFRQRIPLPAAPVPLP